MGNTTETERQLKGKLRSITLVTTKFNKIYS